MHYGWYPLDSQVFSTSNCKYQITEIVDKIVGKILNGVKVEFNFSFVSLRWEVTRMI